MTFDLIYKYLVFLNSYLYMYILYLQYLIHVQTAAEQLHNLAKALSCELHSECRSRGRRGWASCAVGWRRHQRSLARRSGSVCSRSALQLQSGWAGRAMCGRCRLLVSAEDRSRRSLKWPLEAAAARLSGMSGTSRSVSASGSAMWRRSTNKHWPPHLTRTTDPATVIDAGLCPAAADCLAASELCLSNFKSDDGVAHS